MTKEQLAQLDKDTEFLMNGLDKVMLRQIKILFGILMVLYILNKIFL